MSTSFIRIADIWVPGQGDSLVFGNGWFSPAQAFEAAIRSLSFRKGAGLPGQAWAEGRPLLLKDFEQGGFQRAAMAREAGLRCAIALPFFPAGQAGVVLVLYGGSEDARAGAIELWHNNPRVTTDMTLVDGFYGTASDAFEVLSKDTFLPRGTGLPGLAWQRGGSVFMDDLGASPRFLRGATAAEAGITRGLALPCPTRTDEACVLTLLSALGTPIAQKVESWVPDAGRRHLQRSWGFCETQGRWPASAEPIVHLEEGPQGAVARSFLTGLPNIEGSTVHVPIVADGEVNEVLTLTLG